MDDNYKHTDTELWQEFSRIREDTAFAEDVTRPDENIIASFLEGKATASEREQVEKYMLASPEFMDEILELKDLLRNQPQNQDNTGKTDTIFIQFVRICSIAAAVVIFFMGGILFSNNMRPQNSITDNEEDIFLVVESIGTVKEKDGLLY